MTQEEMSVETIAPIRHQLFEKYGKECIQDIIVGRVIPSRRAQAGHAAGAVGRAAMNLGRGFIVFETLEKQAERVAACRACDKHEELESREMCSMCACPILRKTTLTSEKCPHPDGSKWPE